MLHAAKNLAPFVHASGATRKPLRPYDPCVKTVLSISLLVAVSAGAQVIDVHLHAPTSEKNAIAMKDAAKQIHLENAVLIASQADLAKYKTWLDQSIPALPLPCEGGKMPNAGIPCVNDGSEWPKIDQLRAMVESGEVK